MDKQDFNTRFSDWQTRARVLDRQLRPALKREVNVNQPGRDAALDAAPHPVDEVGVRAEVEAFFGGVLECFEGMDGAQRQQLLNLMAETPNLMHCAVTGVDCGTPEGLRRDLILFILGDQGSDPRKALQTLDGLAERAREMGENPKRLFRKLARLASDRDRHGWGSTREFLSGGPGPE